jgi:mannose-6-phosphate isomerase-like protein (cupin superfamily)
MKKLRIQDIRPTANRLLGGLLGDARVVRGGVHVFAPGETAHPEPLHVHDVHEVFLFIEGAGVLPVSGQDYPIQTGDVFIVEPGEDHHTRSSVESPLVSAWYLMDR